MTDNKEEVKEEIKQEEKHEDCKCKENDKKCCHEHKKHNHDNSKLKEKEAEIEKLKKELEESVKKVQYAQAELVNYRKRKDDEVASYKKYCNQDLITELIPIVDNFERAISLDDNNLTDELSKFLHGFKMMYASLTEVLRKFGVEEISRAGEAFDSNLEEEFKTAAEKLSDDSYTKSLVKTSYGYHIIYRKDTLDKPELNDVKSRILTVLKSNYVSENKNVYEKSLINLREESGLDIKDTELKKVYKNYTKDYE